MALTPRRSEKVLPKAPDKAPYVRISRHDGGRYIDPEVFIRQEIIQRQIKQVGELVRDETTSDQ